MANLGGGAEAHARFNLYETGNTSSNGVQELRSSSNSMRDFDARTGALCVLVGKRTIKREISTMKLIRHPNVIRMYEVMASKTKIYIVMELVTGGELFDKIASRGRLKEDDARRYFQQLINAIDYCHSRGFYHRDLKIKREISTMKLIRHPNVIRMYEVMASKTKIYIVMELVTGGELFDKIASRGRLKEDDARRYFQQLINAIDYCHSRGFYHRDLKVP